MSNEYLYVRHGHDGDGKILGSNNSSVTRSPRELTAADFREGDLVYKLVGRFDKKEKIVPMLVEVGKMYETRGGYKAHILYVGVKPKHLIAGLLKWCDDEEEVMCWDQQGKYYADPALSNYDLILPTKIVPGERLEYVNLEE